MFTGGRAAIHEEGCYFPPRARIYARRAICPSRADKDEHMEKSPPPSGLAVEHLATVCGNGGCPTVYRTNRGTLVVQGYPVEGADVGVDLPAGELLVEIPVDLLEQATRAVS